MHALRTMMASSIPGLWIHLLNIRPHLHRKFRRRNASCFRQQSQDSKTRNFRRISKRDVIISIQHLSVIQRNSEKCIYSKRHGLRHSESDTPRLFGNRHFLSDLFHDRLHRTTDIRPEEVPVHDVTDGRGRHSGDHSGLHPVRRIRDPPGNAIRRQHKLHRDSPRGASSPDFPVDPARSGTLDPDLHPEIQFQGTTPHDCLPHRRHADLLLIDLFRRRQRDVQEYPPQLLVEPHHHDNRGLWRHVPGDGAWLHCRVVHGIIRVTDDRILCASVGQ